MAYVSPMLAQYLPRMGDMKPMGAAPAMSGKTAFPAIYRATDRSALRDVAGELEQRFAVPSSTDGLSRTNMLSTWATPRTVEYFADQDHVTHIWFDQTIQVPELMGEAQGLWGGPGPFGRGVLPSSSGP